MRHPENRWLRSCDGCTAEVYGPTMISPDRVDAVVFDMGGVLVIPAPGPVSAIVQSAGIDLVLDDDAAHQAHYAGVAAITRLLASASVAESDPAVWAAYDRAYFAAGGVHADRLDDAAAARHEARVGGDSTDIWTHVLTDNRSAFARIATELPAAVVTNNNGTAVEQCRDMAFCQIGLGPLPSVAAIVDSAVIGIAKPDPRIFAPALAALGTDPARTLYVGDTVHADVHGATAAGMAVVQVDPYDHHADHDHWRVPDVVALADHLLGAAA